MRKPTLMPPKNIIQWLHTLHDGSHTAFSKQECPFASLWSTCSQYTTLAFTLRTRATACWACPTHCWPLTLSPWPIPCPPLPPSLRYLVLHSCAGTPMKNRAFNTGISLSNLFSLTLWALDLSEFWQMPLLHYFGDEYYAIVCAHCMFFEAANWTEGFPTKTQPCAILFWNRVSSVIKLPRLSISAWSSCFSFLEY